MRLVGCKTVLKPVNLGGWLPFAIKQPSAADYGMGAFCRAVYHLCVFVSRIVFIKNNGVRKLIKAVGKFNNYVAAGLFHLTDSLTRHIHRGKRSGLRAVPRFVAAIRRDVDNSLSSCSFISISILTSAEA